MCELKIVGAHTIQCLIWFHKWWLRIRFSWKSHTIFSHPTGLYVIDDSDHNRVHMFVYVFLTFRKHTHFGFKSSIHSVNWQIVSIVGQNTDISTENPTLKRTSCHMTSVSAVSLNQLQYLVTFCSQIKQFLILARIHIQSTQSYAEMFCG